MEETLKHTDLLIDPDKYFDTKRRLEDLQMVQLKKDQAENGEVYKENGAWFFRDGTELSFEKAFGS